MFSGEQVEHQLPQGKFCLAEEAVVGWRSRARQHLHHELQADQRRRLVQRQQARQHTSVSDRESRLVRLAPRADGIFLKMKS